MEEARKSIDRLKAGPHPGLGWQHECRDSCCTPPPPPPKKSTSLACASHTGSAPTLEGLAAASNCCILRRRVLSQGSPQPALSPHCHHSCIHFGPWAPGVSQGLHFTPSSQELSQ